jgi:hypothetical protein
MCVPAFAHEGLHRFAVAAVYCVELCWIVQFKILRFYRL